jgi:hypothetical protein
MAQSFSRFAEFYPFYLNEHRHPMCRRLHFFGTSAGLVLFVYAIVMRDPLWIVAALAAGYSFAWLGHLIYEKNRPATFRHPLYSFIADWVMWSQMLRGRIPF